MTVLAMHDLFKNCFTHKMNIYFDSNVNFHGHALSALTHALAS